MLERFLQRCTSQKNVANNLFDALTVLLPTCPPSDKVHFNFASETTPLNLFTTSIQPVGLPDSSVQMCMLHIELLFWLRIDCWGFRSVLPASRCSRAQPTMPNQEISVCSGSATHPPQNTLCLRSKYPQSYTKGFLAGSRIALPKPMQPSPALCQKLSPEPQEGWLVLGPQPLDHEKSFPNCPFCFPSVTYHLTLCLFLPFLNHRGLIHSRHKSRVSRKTTSPSPVTFIEMRKKWSVLAWTDP